MSEKKTETTKTTLILPTPLWKSVLHRAIDEDVSASAIVEKALDAFLKSKPKGGGHGSR